MSESIWKGKISNSQQLGGIETSILDNGPEKGVRIAWINTGSGLRYKVVLDRGMDIVDAFFNEKSLAWISHQGISSPQPFSNQGIDWLRTFAGGLLTTCGLSSMGPPNEGHGLHGRFSNLSATIISIQQPDIHTGNMGFEIKGKIKETSIFGPSLEVTRTISGEIGSAEIIVSDSILNCGNTPAPFMLLYHVNCGWPLIDKDTRVVWKGVRQARANDDQLSEFNKKSGFQRVSGPLDDHKGFGEDVAFIRPEAEDTGQVLCGFMNDSLQLGLKIGFSKKELPWLIHWQHLAQNEYVTALEPATNPPIGQSKAKEEGTLTYLKPGEKRDYHLRLEVLTGEKVKEFKM